MAKIGKYSSGMGDSVKKASSPYGQSNKGYDARSGLSSAFKSSEDIVMSKTKTGTTGRPLPVKRG